MPKPSSDTVRVTTADSGTMWKAIATDASERTVIAFSILGEPASKSNSRNFSTNRRTGRMFTRKSDKALAYAESFLLQVPPGFKGLSLGSETQFLIASVKVWYASWKPDVDVELIWDCLQKAGVISNDRWIREKHIYGAYIDKENPRVDIRLEELSCSRIISG